MACTDPKPHQSLIGCGCWDDALLDGFHDLYPRGLASQIADLQMPSTFCGLVPSSTTRNPIAPPDSVRHFSLDMIGEDNNKEGYGNHAALQYEDIEDAGPPALPQEFPTPFLLPGTRTQVRAKDHRTGVCRYVSNVLVATHDSPGSLVTSHFSHYRRNALVPNTAVTDRSYLIKKRISRCKFGNNYLAVTLRRREENHQSSFDNERKQPESERDVQWESSNEVVVVTVSPCSAAIRAYRGSQNCKREGIVHAIAAQQHIGNYHPHVLGLLDAFQDETNIYTVNKFHSGVNLQTLIVDQHSQGQYVPNEAKARGIFSQLLEGIFHLQLKGVYHSNLSLENIYVDPSTNMNLVITDLGRSVRVPYNDPSNFGCITGETEGTSRRLLKFFPQDFQAHSSENRMYLPPEILESLDSFDGFAVDLWAAGCILFCLLTGIAPFQTAHYWDKNYACISKGNLKGLLKSIGIQLSDVAISLLQNMFWKDPRDRLTLAQISEHPWVKNECFVPPPPEVSIVSPKSSMNIADNNISKSMASSLIVSSSGKTSNVASYTTAEKLKDKSKQSTIKGRSSLTKGITRAFNELLSSSARIRGGSSRKSRKVNSCGGLSSAAATQATSSPSSHKSSTRIGCSDSRSFCGLEIPAL